MPLAGYLGRHLRALKVVMKRLIEILAVMVIKALSDLGVSAGGTEPVPPDPPALWVIHWRREVRHESLHRVQIIEIG